MKQLTLDVTLAENAGFAAFVPGPNAEALAAVRRHAERRADPVIWLRGPTGVGKSHLLSAACNAVNDGGATALLIGAADLRDASASTQHQWARCTLVAVDDIDTIAGDAQAERAMFRLFNALTDHGGALLVAARGAPRETPFGLPDLASRLSSGPVYKLAGLSDEQRLAALVTRADLRGFDLPEEAARYLMQRVPRDLCSLLALLDQLDSASLRAQRRLTVPFVREVLREAQWSEDVQH